ncbi:4Fe-4S dicluster domain-containing protein [Nakamurella sp. YIM 132087]|uniref:4Fe-4S dicluster domain-containing protein n=2 Tax=Nakamurella alba TaxID=2665158 RepID=A0A7K1FP41_9ACTN|nr:4Fe-4S dicluster domain-containing protein [Nakamurella alba]
MRLGQPDPHRAGPIGKRLGTLVKEFLGHTRMLKWGIVGAAHWFVMVGFGALVLTLVEAVGETFDPAFEIPWLGHQAWYGLFVEFIGLTTVLGIGTLIAIRQLNLPGRMGGRRSRFEGSNIRQAYFVESVIFVIGLCIFFIRGFKAANGLLPYPTWAAPISVGLGSILPASLAAVSIVALLKVIVSMVWAIVISRSLTMGVAWHRFLAFFNIYFKREDSGRTALGALRPMMSNGEVLNLEEADPEVDVFGAGKVEDFSWKGWLDFSTCTECGRCQSQCPAWNTAKPLSPKLVILSLRDHAHAKAPYLAAGGGLNSDGDEKLTDEARARLAHENPLALLEAARPLIGGAEAAEGPNGEILGGVIDPEVLWDCTTCGACVEQCPVDIEHVDHIVDMRRYQVMIESEFPSELAGLFKNLENKGNPWGQNQSGRMDWAKDLDFEVPVVEDVIDPDHEYLFWVGCAGAFDDRARRTTRAVAELLHMAAVGFAVLGEGETCTGDPARRSGNEFLFQMMAQETVETINTAFGDRVRKKIVVTCPHCFNTLSNEYPDMGGAYEVVHHTQLLNKLVREKRLVRKKVPTGAALPDHITGDSTAPAAGSAAKDPGTVTYHDPCYLGRHNKVYSPPRELIGATGATLAEMPRNSSRALCCGAGGARMWMEEKIGKRINLERTDEALSTGAETIVTGCPFCRVMLTDGLTARQNADEPQGTDVEVMDVAQLLLAGVKGS